MPKVSIIVPVYNTEKYLARCIDSILAQTFTDFELILVNDGSNDNSGKICDEYAAKDHRIVVIHKENGGVSSARNKGIEIAQGEWISFIDADDFISKEYLISFSYDADIIICGVQNFGADNRIIVPPKMAKYTGFNDLKLWLKDNILKLYITTPWAKMFKHSIITKNNLRFNCDLRITEDTNFSYQYLSYCKSLKTISFILYYYFIINKQSKSVKYQLSATDFKNHALNITNTISTLENSFKTDFSFVREYFLTQYLAFFYCHLNLCSKNNAIQELHSFRKQHSINFCKHLTTKEFIYLKLITRMPFLFRGNK